MSRRFVVTALLLVVGLSTACSPDRAAPRPTGSPAGTAPPMSSSPPTTFTVPTGPPVPADGAYFGAWVEPQPYSQPGRVQTVDRFEKAMGRQLDVVHLYRTWDQRVGTTSDLAFARRGDYLLLSWAAADTRRIASGAEDALIRQRAREIGALPTKVFVRWRWEMDRPNLAEVVHSPADYVRAWRHMRAIFAAERVRNAGWVWCPTAAGFSSGRAPAYYPGDGQVDWLCADVYPEKPWVKGRYEPFGALAQPFLRWAAQHPKPIMIGEYGVPRTYGDKRARWLTAAGEYAQEIPQIKAMVYFAGDPPNRPETDHMAVWGDPAAAGALATTARDPWFNRRQR